MSYEKSNNTTSVYFNRLSKTEFTQLLNAKEERADREDKAQKLFDYLCKKYNIPICKVSVLQEAQKHTTENNRLKRVTHGSYRTQSYKVTVYNLTARRKKVVSIKTFIDTVLHEFMHHYDLLYLKLENTLHTAGFYTRISDLKKKLEQ